MKEKNRGRLRRAMLYEEKWMPEGLIVLKEARQAVESDVGEE